MDLNSSPSSRRSSRSSSVSSSGSSSGSYSGSYSGSSSGSSSAETTVPRRTTDEDREEDFGLFEALCNFLETNHHTSDILKFFEKFIARAGYVISKDFFDTEIENITSFTQSAEPIENLVQRFLDRFRQYGRNFEIAARLAAVLYPDSVSHALLASILEELDLDTEIELERVEDIVQKGILKAEKRRDRRLAPKIKKPTGLPLPPPPRPLTIVNFKSTAVPEIPASAKKVEIKDQESVKKECEKRKTSGLQNIWNHLTISRDQTAASDTANELLSILFSPTSMPIGHQVIQNIHQPTGTASESLNLHTRPIAQYQPASQVARGQLPQGAELDSVFVPGPLRTSHMGQPYISRSPINVTLRNSIMDNTNPQPQMMPPHFELSANQLSQISPSGAHPGLNGDRQLPQLPLQSESYDQLLSRLTSLQIENKHLKGEKGLQKSLTLHFVTEKRQQPAVFLEEPFWQIPPGPLREPVLRGHLPIFDINGYIRQKTDVAFVIAKYYLPEEQRDEARNAARANQPSPQPIPSTESILLNSQEMIDAVKSFVEKQPHFEEAFPNFDVRAYIPAPYLFWYHYRSAEALAELDESHRELMELLTLWIEENYGNTYSQVNELLKRSVITQDTMPFLVRPGDVICWKDHRVINASIARSWPRLVGKPVVSKSSLTRDWLNNMPGKGKTSLRWTVDSWQYKYDGLFLQASHVVDIVFQVSSADEEVSITSLSAYPLKYADESYRTTLEKRGFTFWGCRNRNLVSYEDSNGFYGNGERFMVDFNTYRQLHHDSTSFKNLYSTIDDPNCERMSTEIMEANEPPPSPEIYVFPNTIPGYDLRSKKWVDLEVDLMRKVTWNKKSFDHLVVDEETKELIQALIMHQIAEEQSTDIIDRKGNGLIILLHGGPGTGKTFTAESVAEIAEKPLFRVTCGDIGTKPEQVEKYLESVLHLGKIWGCVVLIDEAEVFLEQRSLDNLERNALVSVFLRVLEYYEGILILTSNRVGTFDEAFKSRILLSLHYENLSQGQRTEIWKNFLRRLKEMDQEDTTSDSGEAGTSQTPKMQTVGINFDNVECYISELAQHELNGRQIRNAITSARQFATFRKEPMSYKHLKHVIAVSSKFDKYLKTVQEGYSDDQIARGDGIR